MWMLKLENDEVKSKMVEEFFPLDFKLKAWKD